MVKARQERLQKTLANRGVGSRRKCESLILDGKVSVDGRIVRELGMKIDPRRANICVDGAPIPPKLPPVTLILNKPAGVITTLSDPGERTSISSLIPGKYHNRRIVHAGRLDKETTGLIVLTDDGDLVYRLTHPKYELTKIYEATVEGDLTQQAIERLEEGVALKDGMTRPAQVAVLERNESTTRVQLGIHEGRNRQVRRMFDAVAHPVQRLKRTAIGPLELGDLAEGECRSLSHEELEELKAILYKDRKA